MIIGIIGKVGSGKSACVKYLQEHYDVTVFSCDDIAKELIEKGEVDYKIGSAYEFFTNESLQAECRKKVHPKVFKKIIENINNFENYIPNNKENTIFFKNKNNFCEQTIVRTKKTYVIESALPSETLHNICDKVITIYNSYEKKHSLLKEHRDYTDNQTKLIYESQKFYDKYYDKADYKIENNGTKEELLEKLKEVIDEICIICK